MIFRTTDFSKIPYPFLHDIVSILSKKFTINRVYMDPKGEIAIKFIGELSDSSLKYIIKTLIPADVKEEDIIPISCQDFYYNSDDNTTEVYSPEDIDYRKVQVKLL